MASVWFSSFLKGVTDCLSLIRSPPSTSSAITSTVADDLEKLERMLQRIKAMLVDAEERQILDQSVKLWLKEIKDVAYDAEDLFDEYKYEVLRDQVEKQAIAMVAATPEASLKSKYVEGKEEVTPLASSAFNIAANKISILSSMAHRIKEVRERLDEISKHLQDLDLKPEDGERRRDSSSEYPQPTSHMVNERDVYAREDDKIKLIDWLFSDLESKKFEVLAVVGKGGLGKTTLAQLVYNDKNVSDYFKTRMWMCVSDDFNVARLTRAMIESNNKESCTLADQLSPLQESLHQELQGKRVLLVLDDVWNENRSLWESLIIPFQGAEMVRIIITARNEPVAEIMQTTNPYHLGCLPEDQCWQLFVNRAFYDRDPEQFPSLVELGKKIVKKCDGLPLTVKLLGGLLQREIDEDRWKDVLQSKMWDNKTDIALILSYIRMPSHLKPCFEICSMFPKGYNFDKDDLVKLWAAHGYIQHNEGKNDVKEIGYTYFNELQRRSFFDKLSNWQAADRTFQHDEGINDGKWYQRRSFFDELPGYGRDFYKMHDDIHDLAHYVEAGMDLSDHIKHTIRHLSIENKSSEFNLDHAGTLRTLIVKGFGEDAKAIDDILQRNITRLRHLRYLYIRYFPGEILLPDRLRSLICLRHLDLGTDKDLRLPKSIGDLYNLLVLKITCHGLVEIPETLTNLVSLTTVEFRSFRNEQLPALGQLPSLISLILYGLDSVKSIGNEFYRGQNNQHRVAFPSLTSLDFEHLSNWRKWDAFREGDFPQLQKLRVYLCRKLPSLPSLGNLSSLLHISLCESTKPKFLPVGSLPPNLKTLENSFHLKLCSRHGFGELTKLERLSGLFVMRTDEVLRILKHLVSPKFVILTELQNAYDAWNDEGCLRDYNSTIEKLLLDWYNRYEIFGPQNIDLILDLKRADDDVFTFDDDGTNSVSDDDGTNFEPDDDGTDDSGFPSDDMASFFTLEKLQTHTNLKELYIFNYHSAGYPSWIGDPSFHTLTEIKLGRCSNDQLPTLGQLPFLQVLVLDKISRLTTIGDEFCRGTMINNDCDDINVAFPSLTFLQFFKMYDWKKWCGVLDQDFPSLETLQVISCPNLRMDPESFPQRFLIYLDDYLYEV